MKPILLLLSFVVLSLCTIPETQAQKQANNWYFGQGCAFNFSSGSPVFVSGSQTGLPDGNNSQEGTTSISDSAGNLLFYSGGRMVWNRNNLVMPNGDNLMGGQSSTQSCLAVPLPGSNSLFYLFTTDELQSLTNGFRYSIVNMCLNNGLGDIIPCKKNVLVLDTVSEKLCAMRDSTGNYWILVHKLFSDAFYAYYLSPAGLSDPVITHIGSYHGSGNSVLTAVGQMKFSPDGKRVALTVGNQAPCLVDIFNFNPATGTLSHWISTSILHSTGGYGVEFSPDNSKLYVTDAMNNMLMLIQINLQAGGDDAVIASQILISSYTALGMQLGPDDKIYISNGNDSIDVINFPNLAGTACNFAHNVYGLQGNFCRYTLPGFVAGFNYGNGMPACSSLSVQKQVTNATCTLPGSVTMHLAGGTPPYTVTWNTVPVQTGLTATNLLSGTYIATIANAITNCGGDVTFDTVQVNTEYVAAGPITAMPDTLCQGQTSSLVLLSNANDSIQWQSSVTGSDFADISGAEGTAKYKTGPVSQSIYYRAVVSKGGCSGVSDTIKLIVPPPLTALFTENISGKTATFNSGASKGKIISYYWDFGDGQTSIEANPIHNYTRDTVYNVCLTIYDRTNCSYTLCRHVDLSANGIATITTGGFAIYPNPFSSTLLIETKGVNNPLRNIELYDVLGRLMINIIPETGSKTISIDASGFSKGMYFVRISTGQSSYTQKLIKQ